MRTSTKAAGIALPVIVALTGPAHVHPHVFADAHLDLSVNADGTVRSLHHQWRFDDIFSSTVIMEFDKNVDLKLDEAELEDVSQTVYASLAEYKYFQLVTQNGREIEMKPPERLVTNFEDEQLVIEFESEPKEALKLSGKTDFGVYDPSFYTAIDFTDDVNLAVEGIPPGCTRKVVRPDPNDAIEQNRSTLTEAFFNDPTGTNFSKIFATKLELNC